MTSNSSTDRRRHERHERSFEIRGGTGPHDTTARMVASNLSMGGVSCTSAVDFPEMTRLAVRMMIPVPTPAGADVRPLDAEAVVVRREEIDSNTGNGERYRLALFFTQLDDHARGTIERFLNGTI